MLAEAGEGRIILAKDAFKHGWRHCSLILIPHLIDQLGIGHDESAVRPERILLLEFLDKCEAILKEVLGQLVCVGEALQA